MKYEQGKSKTGGRIKGKPNKITSSIRLKLFKLIEGNIDGVSEDINLLTPQERISTLCKFLEFVLPKPKDSKIDISNLTDEEIQVIIDNILSRQNE